MKKEKVYKIKINLKSHELVNFLTSWDFSSIKIGSAVVKGEQKSYSTFKGRGSYANSDTLFKYLK